MQLLQHDAPWIFGFHPKSYTLGHTWLHNRKPTEVGNNILKYQRIDVAERERRRARAPLIEFIPEGEQLKGIDNAAPIMEKPPRTLPGDQNQALPGWIY